MSPQIIQIAQVVVSLGLMASILMQSRGAGLSGVFGGGNEVYRTKRGVEKFLFITTIILAALFMLLAVAGIITTHTNN